MKLGAYDYVTKPFRVDEFKLVLKRMEEKVRLVLENEYLRDRVRNDQELSEITGSSPRIQDVLRMVSRLKDTRTPVLITGKAAPARNWSRKPFIFEARWRSGPLWPLTAAHLCPPWSRANCSATKREPLLER
jgi:two-component system response regulator AtoC